MRRTMIRGGCLVRGTIYEDYDKRGLSLVRGTVYEEEYDKGGLSGERDHI